VTFEHISSIGSCQKLVIMPYCIADDCDINDSHDASADVSFHCLPLTKPDLLKQVIIEGNRV